MNDLTPSYFVNVDHQRGELHFSQSGFFDTARMNEFVQEIARQIGPLLAEKRKIRAFGDLSGYVAQSREMGTAMAETLARAEAAGTEKVAIVITSPILKMQYMRVSEGRNVEIFSDKVEALAWLRRD